MNVGALQQIFRARPRLRRPAKRKWVGQDLASLRSRGGTRGRGWVSIFLVAVLVALLLAAVRMQAIQVRYELSELLSVENQLLEQRNEARAQVRRLRDPMRLRGLAPKLGFSLPERVIRLADHMDRRSGGLRR